ncbi:type IV pilus biogenesis protein PilM [Alicyclobacillus acidoterrestris]|uniref:Pilus assembly protein PilM n=1 Tax=Alicyclobacillus acidoterrestris (strain ATCC 49025 / DSM 3922 / CIP 106132 / NCIMB 13137 / GD3B) TaxID=1356854 RepID=T0BJJ3_ALIAG|nr:pilus assembly protein PilM [Alicyclobacillus acidoterrestris]EPZ44133.1 hypothetical protein N007_11460 [Alicyclobacillus acidoterrestris ATCC 49025]UNO49652.1 pilus assembly protein PilM [Alicyclobacillus acidoterrestris]
MARGQGTSRIGLDIGLDAIRVVELQVGQTLRLQQMSEQPVEAGVFHGGDDVDWIRLEQLIDHALHGYKLRGKRVHVSIPSVYTVIRQLTLPNFTDEELREVIEFELTNTIHLPFAEVVFDFVRCPASTDQGEGDNVSVILIAADGAFIRPLVERLRKRKIKVASIDIRPLAKFRVLLRVVELPETFILTEMDTHGTSVHVFHDGLLYLTREVPVILGDKTDSPLEGGFGEGVDDSAAGATAMAATDELSLPATAPARVHPSLEVLSLSDYVGRIASELERTMNFFQYTLNQRSAQFQEIIMTGSHLLNPHQQANITDRTGVLVRTLSFQDVIQTNFIAGRRGRLIAGDGSVSVDYTAAIGLAMREE